MLEQTINHHIQKFILHYLISHEFARFRDLRPPKVDTNLFSYHLKLLQKSGYVEKTDLGYTLSAKGLIYIDRVNTDSMKYRTQPKIITMLLVQDGYGKVLLQKRTKQPYINAWTLPYDKLHIDDDSLMAAAEREANEKLNYAPKNLRHSGDCYIRVINNGEILTTTLAHIFRFETDNIAENDNLKWVAPLDALKMKLAPAVEQIMTRAFFGDDFFFEEFRFGDLQNS